MTPQRDQIFDFSDALAAVLTQASALAAPANAERVPLLAAQGRILAEPLLADRDQPPFDRSTRDGFAVSAHHLSRPAELRIVGLLPAGTSWAGPPLQPGEALEIMTGAPVPPGADAVAMVEHVHRTADRITPHVERIWQPGENIVPRGAEARAGDLVLAPGTPIGPAEIALAAACGAATVRVFARPRVAIVATGDELVELDVPLGPTQIRNSNSFALAALVAASGADPIRLPITSDDRTALAASLRRARECDLVLLSGGVSMGLFDLVEETLLAAGATFFFTGVRMQPGKPVVFGAFPDGSLFFGLPGNPISTQVTFTCFVEPLLRALCGIVAGGAPPEGPRWALARLAQPAEARPNLTRLLPGRTRDGVEVTILGWQGSGDLAANARANCYVEIPPGDAPRAADSLVRILLR